MKIYLNFLLVAAAVVLAACSASPSTKSTPPIAAAATTTIPPTNTATPAATSTPLPTDMPTQTPTATATATPTATPTNTPIPETAVNSITLAPVVTSGLEKPVFLTHAFDARRFVVEQAGRIRIIAPDGTLVEEPFLDIVDRVDSVELEQGLLSVVFHPDYKENGRFFMNYTNLDGHTHISEFAVDPNDPNRAAADSEIVLLMVEQPYANHNGGQLQFGPDGYLYVGMGDGGSANDPLNSGQDPATLLGALLRLDVDFLPGQYAIPATNPFVADDSRANEIWAWGLRNPWRFSFDPVKGNLFIADVGQNLWEEIHFQPAASAGGENYGWNILEGSHCFNGSACDQTGLELPIFEYDHGQGCSITGGYVYRGQEFLSLYGNYFLADFCQGTFWRLFQEADGSWSSAVVLETDFPISSFGKDFLGELYALDHNGGVYQIQP